MDINCVFSDLDQKWQPHRPWNFQAYLNYQEEKTNNGAGEMNHHKLAEDRVNYSDSFHQVAFLIITVADLKIQQKVVQNIVGFLKTD